MLVIEQPSWLPSESRLIFFVQLSLSCVLLCGVSRRLILDAPSSSDVTSSYFRFGRSCASATVSLCHNMGHVAARLAACLPFHFSLHYPLWLVHAARRVSLIFGTRVNAFLHVSALCGVVSNLCGVLAGSQQAFVLGGEGTKASHVRRQHPSHQVSLRNTVTRS